MKQIKKIIVWGVSLPLFACANTKEQTLPLKPVCASDIIKSLYTEGVGYTIPPREAKLIRRLGGDPVYGEITFSAMQTLLDDLHLTKEDVFYDLGCGVGQACIQVALVTPAQAVGVELSKTRLKHATEATENLNKIHGIDICNTIEWRQEDISKTNLGNATVLFLCSTCFSNELMQRLVTRFSALPQPLRIITLRQLPANNFFSLLKKYNLPMTWNNDTPVYVYQSKKLNTLGKKVSL